MELPKIKINDFEGPFDLLLHLIRKNQMSIYNVRIYEITNQYLNYLNEMKEMDLEITSEFIVVAATLIEIKSKHLLPKPKKEEENEEDVEKNLLEKLIVHEAFLDIREKQQEDTQLEQGVLDALSQALTAIDQSREIEGQGIYQVLKENQQQLLGKIMELQTFIAVYEADHRQRFEKKLTEYLGEQVDQERLLTEMAILLERGDIHEELDRMMIHLDSMTTLLEAKSPIGRELDFLIQEMNREVNTIGSKSSPIEIKNSVVQMKTIIEKIREQVQNIE